MDHFPKLTPHEQLIVTVFHTWVYFFSHFLVIDHFKKFKPIQS